MKNSKIRVNSRRKDVIKRLQKQLEIGVKNTKQGKVQLTKEDITRINNTIDILQQKVELNCPANMSLSKLKSLNKKTEVKETSNFSI